MSKKEYSAYSWRLEPGEVGKGIVSARLRGLAEKGWRPIMQSNAIVDYNVYWFYTFERDVVEAQVVEETPEERI